MFGLCKAPIVGAASGSVAERYKTTPFCYISFITACNSIEPIATHNDGHPFHNNQRPRHSCCHRIVPVWYQAFFLLRHTQLLLIFRSGAMMSLSLMAVPVFLETTSKSSQLFYQWTRMYHYGHQVLPGMAITTLALYGYAAFSRRATKRAWIVYALAGIITISMLPFTWIFMVPTNNTLFRLEVENRAASLSSIDYAQDLVRHWSWLHLLRSLFPLAGAALGLTATLRSDLKNST